MPLNLFLAVSGSEAAEKAVSITDALMYSVIGFAIVFAVLIVLMAFIGIMSKLLSIGKNEQKPAVAPIAAPAPVQTAAPVAPVAPAAVPDGAMYVTLGGNKHTVTVTEKLPRFNVTVNGKAHAVDVEELNEEEAAE